LLKPPPEIVIVASGATASGETTSVGSAASAGTNGSSNAGNTSSTGIVANQS
jgi:hypothetical protein